MAQSTVIMGHYDRDQNPDLLPHGIWMQLAATTVTNADRSVTVTLSIEHNGVSQEVLSATDAGRYDGTPPITGAAPQGIRTDFMDVRFKDYRIRALP
jgi:hypothetical protein